MSICTGNSDQVWCYDDYVDDESQGHFEYTEKEILDLYSPFWKGRMEELGRHNLISDENCIDDWIIVNWAYKKEEQKCLVESSN